MYKYKNISELSEKELTKIWEVNEKLRSKVEDDYIESEMFYISEILHCIKNSLKNWSIGFYNQNYIDIKNNYDFLNGLLEIQKDYCFLEDKYTNNIRKLIDEYNEFYCMSYDDENYERIEEEIYFKIEKIKEIFLNEINDITNHNDEEDLKRYFIEFYMEERIKNMEDYYIDNNYVLYEDYVRSYK